MPKKSPRIDHPYHQQRRGDVKITKAQKLRISRAVFGKEQPADFWAAVLDATADYKLQLDMCNTLSADAARKLINKFVIRANDLRSELTGKRLKFTPRELISQQDLAEAWFRDEERQIERLGDLLSRKAPVSLKKHQQAVHAAFFADPPSGPLWFYFLQKLDGVMTLAQRIQSEPVLPTTSHLASDLWLEWVENLKGIFREHGLKTTARKDDGGANRPSQLPHFVCQMQTHFPDYMKQHTKSGLATVASAIAG